MNVELVNPTLVLGLFAGRDAAGPKPRRWRAPAWPRRARAPLDERLRWRRAWRGVRQLDDRALEDPVVPGSTALRPRGGARRAPSRRLGPDADRIEAGPASGPRSAS